jgi:hypothetical protein
MRQNDTANSNPQFHFGTINYSSFHEFDYSIMILILNDDCTVDTVFDVVKNPRFKVLIQ